jgi:GTPase
LRRPPGQPQPQAAPALEDHDELDIIDQLGLSDDATPHVRLRTLLLDPAESNVTSLSDYVQARLVEGHGEALFDLGLEDNGDSMGFTKEEWDIALKRLEDVVEELKADMKLLMTRNVGVVGEGEIEVGPLNAKEKGACGKLILRKRPESVDDVIETRIAVVGNGES